MKECLMMKIRQQDDGKPIVNSDRVRDNRQYENRRGYTPILSSQEEIFCKTYMYRTLTA